MLRRGVCGLWGLGAPQLAPAAAASGALQWLPASAYSSALDQTIGSAPLEMPSLANPSCFHHLPGAEQPADGPQLCSVPKRRVGGRPSSDASNALAPKLLSLACRRPGSPLLPAAPSRSTRCTSGASAAYGTRWTASSWLPSASE
jgi:hypothetical protein